MKSIKKKVVKAKSKKQKSKATKAVKKVEGEYLISIYLNDQVFEGSGATCLDALSAVVIPPQMVKTKVVLQMFHADKKAEQVIVGMQLRRILNGRTAKEVWAKRIEQKLK